MVFYHFGFDDVEAAGPQYAGLKRRLDKIPTSFKLAPPDAALIDKAVLGKKHVVDLPPFCLIAPYTVAKPSPVPSPCGFVVKNGSKRCGRAVSAMPESECHDDVARLLNEKTPRLRGFLRVKQAAEETRTLDLLHGKQTL